MNLFILDSDPWAAAKAHHDKHVVKMILESAQMLCTAHHLASLDPSPHLYKPCFHNHPCTKWVRENNRNYYWGLNYFIALCFEYSHRYNKIHSSYKKLSALLVNVPETLDFSSKVTDFAQAMPDKYKNKDAVKAYRDYYKGEKINQSKWTRRQEPSWING
tara:strand:+ start:575 stop:1054 length:480 start_codon:yes stop_codon:yes gene_type:complete